MNIVNDENSLIKAVKNRYPKLYNTFFEGRDIDKFDAFCDFCDDIGRDVEKYSWKEDWEYICDHEHIHDVWML